MTTLHSPTIEDPRRKSLTPREGEFLELLSKGYTNKDIGKKLFVVNRTVQDTLMRIYTKLGFTSKSKANQRVQATLWYWNITTEALE